MQITQTGIPTDFTLHRAGIGLGFAEGDLHGGCRLGTSKRVAQIVT